MPIIDTYTARDINRITKLDTKKEDDFLQFITKKRGKDGFWEVVKAIMDRFYGNPSPEVRQAMRDLEEEAKFARDNSFNRFGASKSMSLRHLGLIPDRLVIALNRIYDRDLPVSEKDFNKGFFTRYPQLLCCKSI